jgi:hypothetical protein
LYGIACWPGLAIQSKGASIRRYQGKYLFNVKSLSKVFRAKMLQAINDTKISLPVGVPKVWNVHSKRAGTGEKTLTYLSRYLYRGVISEKRILSMDNGEVEFEYLCAKTKVYQRKKLPAARFLFSVLKHVLPRGFQRARTYGFLHHNCRVLLTRIQLLLQIALPDKQHRPSGVTCSTCQCVMKLVDVRRPKPLIKKQITQGKQQSSIQPVDSLAPTQHRQPAVR